MLILDDTTRSGNDEDTMPRQPTPLLKNGGTVTRHEETSVFPAPRASGWRKYFFLDLRFCPSCNKVHLLRRKEYYCNKCGMRLVPTHAEQRYSSLLQVESTRFRATLISDLDKVNANAVAELTLWGEKRDAEARAALETLVARTTQHFADIAQRAATELGIALDCKKAATIERYNKSIEKILSDNLADAKQRFKSEMKDQGNAQVSTSLRELEHTLDESTTHLLTEFDATMKTAFDSSLSKFQQDATTTTNTSLSKLQEEITKRLGTVTTTANSAIDDTSAAIERDIADVRKTIAADVLKLRDQLRCEEDRVLHRIADLKATVEEAFDEIRVKTMMDISKQTKRIADTDKETRSVEAHAKALGVQCVNIEARLSSLRQTLGKVETIGHASAERAEELAKLTAQSLGAIEERANTMQGFLTDTDARVSSLRSRITAILEDYEKEVVSAKDKLITPPIDEIAEEILERGRVKMAAELEYRLADLRGQLRGIEDEVFRQATTAERAIAQEAVQLVQSHRSEQYVKAGTLADIQTKRVQGEKEQPRCETCKKRLRYIAKYDRWYCDACERYAPKGVGCNQEKAPESELRKWYHDVMNTPAEAA